MRKCIVQDCGKSQTNKENMPGMTFHRIEILIFIGCGNKTRTQQEVCNLFNAKYPDNPITQSIVSKIEYKFRETGDVEDLPKSGVPLRSDDSSTYPEERKLSSLQISACDRIARPATAILVTVRSGNV
ncbi:hypothetical protein NQ318_022433 [Aromia moschata]|uniref:DUF4817 domain-containing protein n=1 Tax=Aromia moschata TaxID=1265417 RepID=A0AAV8Z6L1_9CUCU|nr:hypothetical protein NQ318_022433 [Aromia moschata]